MEGAVERVKVRGEREALWCCKAFGFYPELTGNRDLSYEFGESLRLLRGHGDPRRKSRPAVASGALLEAR